MNKVHKFAVLILSIMLASCSVPNDSYNLDNSTSSSSSYSHATSSSSSYSHATSSSSIIKKYTITWKNYDGTFLEIDSEVPYGTLPSYDGPTPTRESPDAPYTTYTFIGWSPTVQKVTSDCTYIAQFKHESVKTNLSINNYGRFLSFDVKKQSENYDTSYVHPLYTIFHIYFKTVTSGLTKFEDVTISIDFSVVLRWQDEYGTSHEYSRLITKDFSLDEYGYVEDDFDLGGTQIHYLYKDFSYKVNSISGYIYPKYYSLV